MTAKDYKLRLPIGAFLMAVAFAFASDNNSSDKGTLIAGYIYINQCVPAIKDCNNLGPIPCTYIGLQVWSINTETICFNMLFHRP